MVQLWVIETTFLYVSKSVQPLERNHNINWIIYPKWMPPANSFVRAFSYMGLSVCLLLSSYMWVSLMHTLWHGLCLISCQIGECIGGPHKPLHCREPLLSEQSKSLWWLMGLVGRAGWLSPAWCYRNLLSCTSTGLSLKQKKEKKKACTSALVQRRHKVGIPLWIVGLEKNPFWNIHGPSWNTHSLISDCGLHPVSLVQV